MDKFVLYGIKSKQLKKERVRLHLNKYTSERKVLRKFLRTRVKQIAVHMLERM